MVEEMMMVPTSDYNNLVNYYKGRLTESALLNKAGRLAAERHVTLNNPHLNKSVAVAMSKQGEREIHKLTKRLRTGGTTRGTSVTGGKEDEDDDAMLVSPLEHKLDKILRATEKSRKQQQPSPVVPPTRRRQLPKTPKKHPVKQEEASTSKKSGWISSMKRGALKGVGTSLGVNVNQTSDTDSDDEGATRQKKKKETHPQSGQTVACGAGMGRFYGRQTTQASSLVGLRGRGRGRLKTKLEGVSMCKNGWARRGWNFIGPVISTWDPGRI